MAVAAAGALGPLAASSRDLPPAARVAALALAPLAIAGVAHAARRRAVAPVYALAGAAVVVHLLGYNPFEDPACARVCADVRPLLAGWLSTRVAVGLAAGLAAAAAILAATRVHGATALVAVVALGAAPVPHAVRWEGSEPAFFAPVAVAAVGVALGVDRLRTQRRRAHVDRLLAALTAAGDTGLGPMHVAVPGEERWVDPAGGPAPTTVPGAVVLADEDGPAVRILPRTGVDRDELLAGLTPSTRLALRNARLAAVARTRLADVRASQRRIVTAADAERRRIERDLHDGAQQRLVSVALHLRLAMAGADPCTAAALADAEAGVRTALAHIRRLAHGMFPAALSTEGLDAALDDLGSSSDVDVTVAAGVPEGLPPAVAMTAYTLAAAAVASGPGPVAIEVRRDGDAVVVRVRGARAGKALTDAADRVGAAGGVLTLAATEVTAVIPCGS